MEIADGGGGYGGTAWGSTDVRFMWSVIADQETDSHFDVVGGWRKTADLTLAHLGQVRMYRDNLASVWPPSKSAASAAYIARLDKLIADLQETHDAASANYTAFSTVTLTLSMARQKLKPIFEQYEANNKLNLDWQAEQDTAAAQKSASPTPSPSPRPSPSPSPSPSSQTPPVSSARQEQLNNQARAIMYDLSSTILSGQAALKKPKVYNPNYNEQDSDPDKFGTNSDYGFAAPPLIPSPGSSNGPGSGSTFSPVSDLPETPIKPSTLTPIHPGSVGVGTGNGPILGGVGPTPVITPTTPGLPLAPSPSPIPPAVPPGLMPGIITPSGITGSSSADGHLPNSSKPASGGLLKPAIGAGPAGRMTMPSGGVIGATPGSGMIGQTPTGATSNRTGSASRANPIGGVIGQQSGGTAPRGPVGSQTVRKHRRRGDGSEPSPWDPDNPWATNEGVDPVVLPPEEQDPIDPGPAIGYSR